MQCEIGSASSSQGTARVATAIVDEEATSINPASFRELKQQRVGVKEEKDVTVAE